MLYIMRHGQTDWNVKNKLQGKTDIQLNEKGREMARHAAEEYKDVNIDICYSSPLSRAKETAELVLAGRNIPIITDDRLLEMSFGIFEGVEDGYQVPGAPMSQLFDHPDKYEPVEGAESFEELYARTGDFLEKVAIPLVKEGKDVLIVGHGAMNSSIICQCKNIPLKDFWSPGLENCKLLRLM